MLGFLTVVLVMGADAVDSRCVATDDSGAVLAEAVDADSLACRERLKAKLKALKCVSGNTHVAYRYQRGRGRAVPGTLYCR